MGLGFRALTWAKEVQPCVARAATLMAKLFRGQCKRWLPDFRITVSVFSTSQTCENGIPWAHAQSAAALRPGRTALWWPASFLITSHSDDRMADGSRLSVSRSCQSYSIRNFAQNILRLLEYVCSNWLSSLISLIHTGQQLAAVWCAQEDSFEKELEFYELLNLDTEGEDDLDIDNTTEQVLGFQ